MAVFRVALALLLLSHLASSSNVSTSEYHKQQAVMSISSDQEFEFIQKWPTCPPWKYHKFTTPVVCVDLEYTTLFVTRMISPLQLSTS